MLSLRHDLDLLESDTSPDGGRRWLLRDPANNRFFKLGSDEIKILAYLKDSGLSSQEMSDLAAGISRHFGKTFSSAKVQDFLLFLRQNNLLTVEGTEGRAMLKRQRQHLQPGLFKTVLRNYLFIKLHLIRPNRLLDAITPLSQWLFRPTFWWFIVANTLFALYLTSRQLDTFLGSFVGYLNLSGMTAIAVALALVKIVHELGHAVATRYYGCSVNSMGIAFLLFWPVLFTDTTDAWRLKNRHQRVLIGLSGVLVELAIASLCLTLWNFASPGMFKSVLFVLASTTWVLTLAINLNPLMRFDGYFVLADLLGVENLQERSFALARWKMRESMFGYGFAAPEKPRQVLLVYAYATWVYRFLLYLGITLIIYNYFFKLLGLVLMSVQIFTFLLKPLGRELRFWWEHRKQSRLLPHGLISFSLLMLVLLWLFLPTQGRLFLPGYLRADESLAIYASEPGRLVSLIGSDGTQVKAGDMLVELAMPDLEFRLGQVQQDLSLLSSQLRNLGVSTASAAPRGAIVAEITSARQQQADLVSTLSEQRIAAPFDGVVRDLADDLNPGQWVAAGTQLMTLVRPSGTQVVAYVSEQDVSRVASAQVGRFYTHGGVRKVLEVAVDGVESFPVGELEELYAASSYGGGLQVRDSTGTEEGLRPQESSFRVYLTASQPVPERVLRGTLVLPTTPISPIQRYWRNLLSLLRRESGF